MQCTPTPPHQFSNPLFIELYPLSHSERHDHRFNQIDRLLGGSFDNGAQQPLDRITLGQLLLEGGYPEG